MSRTYNTVSLISEKSLTLTLRHTFYFWTPTKEAYIGLSELYASHPDFVKFYDNIHPQLLQFLMVAMKIFAERELK